MAEVASTPAPVTESVAPSPELQTRFTQFVAATQSAQTSDEVGQIFNTITASSGGTAWLQEILDAQTQASLTSGMMAASIGVSGQQKTKCSVLFILSSNRCDLQIAADPPVGKGGRASFYGNFQNAVFQTKGELTWTDINQLAQANYVQVNVGPISTQVYFYLAGNIVGIYLANGIYQKIVGGAFMTEWS